MSWLNGKKTYIIAVVAVAYAVVIVGWQQGNWQAALELIMAALGGSAIRHGVEKQQIPPAE